MSVRPWYAFCRSLCRWFSVLFFRARVHGRHHVPESGGVLLLANHQSFFDPVLTTMALAREGHFMARDTLFDVPILGRLFVSLNAYPVRRGTADISAIKETLRRLKEGKVVVAFPEGTRTRDGSIGSFLPGVPAVALKARTLIVPVLIHGAYRSWPRHRHFPLPAEVIVVYGPPIDPVPYADRGVEALTDAVRDALIRLQSQLCAALARQTTPLAAPAIMLDCFGPTASDLARDPHGLAADRVPPAAGACK